MASFNTLYVWKGISGGDWFDNHNWTPGFPEGASPPGDGGADAVAGDGSASEFDVVLGTTVTIEVNWARAATSCSGVNAPLDVGDDVMPGGRWSASAPETARLAAAN